MLRFYRLLTNLVYKEASLVASCNVFNRRWERNDGVPEDSIRTVYNGVDPLLFDVPEAEVTEPVITWVGRIDPLKDLETLIKGFALVHDAKPAARLRLFGGTPAGNESYRDTLYDLVNALGLADSISFEGQVDSPQLAYAAGRIVALTSVSEGFPYTVIEAMSSGRPTVSTDVGGVTEAVGDAGVIVPPRRPDAFAAACLELLEDDARCADLGARARQRVLEFFTLDRAIGTFRTVYQDVARGRVVERAL
jgi:glycosyltransferase involved in cell wall biosynthesis